MYSKRSFFKVSFLSFAALAMLATACRKTKNDNNTPTPAQLITESRDVILPTELSDQIPARAVFSFALYAEGTQTYTAITGITGPEWSAASVPAANLFDETNKAVGTHYAGPTWKIGATDSTKATVLAKRSVNINNIPWLTLSQSGGAPTGKFAGVIRVVRMNTKGGIAPTERPTAADVTNVRKVSVPYTAIYWFYK